MKRWLLASISALTGTILPLAALSQGHDARALIRRSIDAVGLERAKAKILHYHVAEANLQPAQSDRMYPPYYSLARNAEVWFDPVTNIQRTSSATTFFGSGPSKPVVIIASQNRAVMVRDTLVIPIGSAVSSGRTSDPMNAWALLREWERSSDVMVGNPTLYRDYVRNVVVRTTSDGEERLFIDRKTGFPVKIDFVQSHYLWGQVQVEYLYSTWIQVDRSFLPSGVFRMIDGEVDLYRTIGMTELISHDQAPSLQIPETKGPVPPGVVTGLFNSPQPDTIGISSKTYLTKNRFYTEAISLIDGTVYVFDATLGEQRAKQDEAWIKKLFPGKHPIVVVVTDLAWPHIAGVRYWVSKGAAIVSHRVSESFLKKVFDRKWTLNPDELEQKRSKIKFKFTPVDKELSLAGGKIRLYAIDGIGSEGGLMAYLPDDKFLWAGDYIQNNKVPTAYATEVWQAVNRRGINPDRVAAQHLPVTKWSVIDSLSRGDQ